MHRNFFSASATFLLAVGVLTFSTCVTTSPGAGKAFGQAPAAKNPATAPDPFGAPAIPAATTPAAQPAANQSAAPSDARVRAALDRRLDIEFVEMPLKDVVMYLQDTTGVPILLKVKKMEEASVSADTPITKNLKQVRLSTGLDLILDENDLAYFIKDGIIHITSADDAKSLLEVRVYNCRDLLEMQVRPNAAVPHGGMMMNSAQSLMSLLTTNVDEPTWTAAGGRGSISEYNGLVVVTQTDQTHRKIERVLDMLREAAGLPVPAAGKVVR